MSTDDLWAQLRRNIDALPSCCFVESGRSGVVLGIERGRAGVRPIESEYTADELNRASNITPEQVEAMRHGARYGFHCAKAHPEAHYAK